MSRPRKGIQVRAAKILICIEPELKEELEELARESRRSLSDYCRYVLEQHFWAARDEDGTVVVEGQ